MSAFWQSDQKLGGNDAHSHKNYGLNRLLGLFYCRYCSDHNVVPITEEATAATGIVGDGPGCHDAQRMWGLARRAWIQWRLPGASPVDKAAVEYWAEGYLSGLAAGTRHDVIGKFRTNDRGAYSGPLLHCKSTNETTGCYPGAGTRDARSSRRESYDRDV